MKWKIILFVSSLTLVFCACEKQDISVFTTDDSGIYFQRVTSYIYNSTTEYYGDSVAYSFGLCQGLGEECGAFRDNSDDGEGG